MKHSFLILYLFALAIFLPAQVPDGYKDFVEDSLLKVAGEQAEKYRKSNAFLKFADGQGNPDGTFGLNEYERYSRRDLETGENGSVLFRGFHGTYDIRVLEDEKEVDSYSIHLKKDGANTWSFKTKK